MPGILTSAENIGMDEDRFQLPVTHCLSQWFSAERILPHGGHLATSGDISGWSTRGRLLLVFSGQRPEMLLNSLQ